MTTDELLERAHRRGFQLLDEEGLRKWLLDLVAAGDVEEIAPDDFQLSEAGRARFVRAGEIE